MRWVAMYKVKAWLYLMRKKGLEIPCPFIKTGQVRRPDS